MPFADHDAPTMPFLGHSTLAVETSPRLGAYRLRHMLGQGGFGTVHVADHPLLGQVALKILRSTAELDVRLFRREGSLVLDHPSIPKVLDHGEIDGRRFVAFQLVEGTSLADAIAAGPWPEERVVALGIRLAEVLEYTHSLAVVHRDLKPRNVLVGADDRVFVLDFGIARLGRIEDATPDGPLGSPAFMAPEQGLGAAVGPPADLYALGVLLYLARTGRLPIEAKTPVAMLAALGGKPPVPIRRRAPDVTPAFAALVMKLLEKDPRDRPASAAIVRRELSDIRRGLGGTGPRTPVARAQAGAGTLLLLTGSSRTEALEELVSAATAFQMDVRRTCASAEDGAHSPLQTLLGRDPVPEGRGRALAALASRILHAGKAGPVMLALEEAHLADDGTLDVLEAVAPRLGEAPVLVVLVAPECTGDLATLTAHLAPRGLLQHEVRGSAEPAPQAPPVRLSAAELLEQGLHARRFGAERLAGARLRGYLAITTPDHPERPRAILELGRSYQARGKRDQALAALAEIADTPADAGVAAGIARLRAVLAIGTEPPGTTVDRFADVLRLARASGTRAEISAAGNDRGLVLRLLDRREEAEAAFREALATWRDLGDDGRAAACLNNLGLVAMETGRLPEARTHLEAAHRLWAAAGDPAGEATALVNQGNVHAELGDLAAARACYEEAARRRRALPDPAALAATLANLGAIMDLAGEHEAAVTVQAEALASARQAGDPMLVANSLDHTGAALRHLGRAADAEPMLLDALALRREIGDRYGEAMSLLNLARIAHDGGRCADALPELEATVRVAGALQRPTLLAQALTALGRCRIDTGDLRGLDDLARATRLADELGARDVGCEARLARARARAAEAPEEARRMATEAVELAREGGLRVALAEALRIYESIV